MTEPSTSFVELHATPISTRTKIALGCVGVFVFTHLLIMIVLVTNVTLMAPEIKSTLLDVKIIVPEMRKTISELGTMLPEITQGMRILKQLCQTDEQCIAH